MLLNSGLDERALLCSGGPGSFLRVLHGTCGEFAQIVGRRSGASQLPGKRTERTIDPIPKVEARSVPLRHMVHSCIPDSSLDYQPRSSSILRNDCGLLKVGTFALAWSTVWRRRLHKEQKPSTPRPYRTVQCTHSKPRQARFRRRPEKCHEPRPARLQVEQSC